DRSDSPATVLKFRDQFAAEAAGRQSLAKLRWPEGFVGPCCQPRVAWLTARGLYHCQHCDPQTSVTAGTLFADTNLPGRRWLEAIGHVPNRQNMVPAPWDCSGSWDWAVITLLGTGCPSCVGRGGVLAATGWPGRGQSMKSISAASDPANAGGEQQGKLWSWWRRRPRVAAWVASGWRVSPTPRKRR